VPGPGSRRRPLALVALVVAAGTVTSLIAFTEPRVAEPRFTNLDGSVPRGFSAVIRWKIWDRLTGQRRLTPDRAPVPSVAPDLALLAMPPAPGEPARITWLGHAAFLVQLDGISLLVDPALMPSIFGGVERNVPPPLRVEDLPEIHAVLVTHSHYDHLDLPTLRAVGAPVVAGLGLERFFADRDLAATELGWWSSTRVGPVRITFVPAQHWSRRGPFDTNSTLWGGFVVEGSRATVYHAGDSGAFPGFAEIGERFPRIDAALLPIGAYDPPWFMEPMHLNPEQALAAFLALGAKTLVPMHWGTFKLADEPLDEPPVRLLAERSRLGVAAERVRVLAVGESLEVVRGRGAVSREAASPAGP
jgi:L-ascorbate metabolism protein UlaG (beta-lactamase superfamily)